MFIDTHCHLNFPQYNEDRAMVIGNAKKANVKKFINPGVDLYSTRHAIDLAQKNPGVIFASAGFHPYEAQHNPDVSQLPTHNIIAVGEIGLDYHQYKGEQALGKKDNQKRLFAEQLELAVKLDLPVILHCREAFDDFFSVLDLFHPRGVIHCFGGGLQDVRMAKARNLFIGIDGNVTYSKQLELIVPEIPLTMLLLETDAPFLTPVPHRGSRNEPKYIPLIAKKIAELQKINVKKIEVITTRNAVQLFHL